MVAGIITTETNGIWLPMDYWKVNHTKSVPLIVNSKSPFTIHYAIWPYVGLISLIATVWLLVYVSTTLSRRHNLKNDQLKLGALYITQATSIAGGYETSMVASPVDI